MKKINKHKILEIVEKHGKTFSILEKKLLFNDIITLIKEHDNSKNNELDDKIMDISFIKEDMYFQNELNLK